MLEKVLYLNLEITVKHNLKKGAVMIETLVPISFNLYARTPLLAYQMIYVYEGLSGSIGGGRVERRCWVNFQCRGVLLVWLIVGQGPTVLAVGASGGCLDIFTLDYPSCPLSPSLWETARYRLKYCLKGPFNPKQPTNQLWQYCFNPCNV